MHEEKEETSVDMIKDKDDLNPVIFSKERIDFDEDDIEEEKPKSHERKPKKRSRITVAKLHQTDKSGKDKLMWKLTDFIKRYGTVKIRRSSRERENRKTRWRGHRNERDIEGGRQHGEKWWNGRTSSSMEESWF
ncbi:hypothetical protein TNCV_2870651 [Trichonephila clavipes]|nr:hypothetical protein TNCV_2870651 [Trichonephila clavipes]